MKREREGRYGLWIFILVFCCSSNVVVRWFRLLSGTSGVWPFSELTPKWGPNFGLSSHCPGLWSLSSFLCHVSEPNNFQTFVVAYFCQEGTYPFSMVANQRIFRISEFFLVIFVYCCHSPSWPTSSALAWFLRVNWTFRRLYVCFSFQLFFSSLISSLEISLQSFYKLRLSIIYTQIKDFNSIQNYLFVGIKLVQVLLCKTNLSI